MRVVILVSALLSGFAALQMGNALQGTLLSVRGGLEGFSPTSIGLVMSGLFGGMAVGSFFAPPLIERAGHTRAFAALASIASAAALVHLLVIEPWTWIAVRTLTGFCFAGLIIIVESWLNGSTDSRHRGRLLAVYSMVGLAAGAVGQLLLSTASPGGYELFVLISIILSLSLVPVMVSKATAPLPEARQQRPSVVQLYRTSAFGCVGALFTGMTIGGFFGLAPLFTQRIGFDRDEIALAMSAATLGALALQWPLGWLSDVVNRRMVVISMTGCAAVICLVAAQLGEPAIGLALGVFFALGGILLPSHSLLVAHINDHAGGGELVQTSGGLVLVNGTGAALGPVLGGLALESLGTGGLFYFLALAQAAIALFGLYRLTRRRGLTRDEQQSFSPVLFQPVAGDLDQPVPEAEKEEKAFEGTG